MLKDRESLGSDIRYGSQWITRFSRK
ncbi:hypothetical protein DERF_014369 [Dermatophagoides farinae]|uniref:Uncharacterized protein n=1 Tax=Dermatophagoides farinae TaxID=6954 RepID=A0A922KWP6_DERFA|nr:hypothetical protein DERF_014369 [Dermatophagoides farinae]